MNIRKSTLAVLGSTLAGILAFACAGTESDASSDADLAASRQAVVISQVFTTGGLAKSRPSADYVELHNRSAKDVKLAGLSLQFTGAADQFDGNETFSLDDGKVIPAGGYYLVQLKAGPEGTKLDADQSIDGLGLGTSGSIALVKTVNPLRECADADACAKNQARAQSLVGYGRGATAEGTPVASGNERLANTEILARREDGCAGSLDNAKDFDFGKPEGGYGTRNSKSSPVVCPQFKGTDTSTNEDGGAANDSDGAAPGPDADGGANDDADGAAPGNSDGGAGNDDNDNDNGSATDAGTAPKDAGTGTGNGSGPGKVTPAPSDDAEDDATPPTEGKKKKTGLEAALGNQPIASSSKSTCAMGAGPATSNGLAGLAGLGLALAAMGRRRSKK